MDQYYKSTNIMDTIIRQIEGNFREHMKKDEERFEQIDNRFNSVDVKLDTLLAAYNMGRGSWFSVKLVLAFMGVVAAWFGVLKPLISLIKSAN